MKQRKGSIKSLNRYYFNLVESCENSKFRIQSIARSARLGKLKEGGWFSKFDYYTKSTIYNLLAPIAIYKLMQKKLTLVDLNADRRIEIFYKLSKQLYLIFSDDFEFARTFNPLEYDPNNVKWQELRSKNSRKYWRQGLPIGLLDKCLDYFIEEDNNGHNYLISFGDFERKAGNIGNNRNSDIHLVRDIFENFHPQNRPILWRLLIAQYQISETILNLRKLGLEEVNDLNLSNILLKYTSSDVSNVNGVMTL